MSNLLNDVEELRKIRNRIGIEAFATALRMLWPNLFLNPDNSTLAGVGCEDEVVNARPEPSKEQAKGIT